MRHLDGRQTRPANVVGRPDGGTERAPVNGGRSSWWNEQTPPLEILAEAIYSCGRALEDADAYTAPWIERARSHLLEACERLRGREAPHGEAPPDAT